MSDRQQRIVAAFQALTGEHLVPRVPGSFQEWLDTQPAVVQCAARGHIEAPWEYVPPPTAGDLGMYRRECPRCGALEVRAATGGF